MNAELQAHTHNHYRPDIDGLRAIAVLSVVIFHAFPEYLGGGFIGVDVFFVISGFLITSLILREQKEERFSLRHFYARRIRRIFPALSLVLGFGLVAGWICLNFMEYKQLTKHTGSSAIFITNFMLLREAGYFDNAADTKPMLHLWSLAIEEQFYFVWPLVLLFFKRLPRWLFPALAVLCLSSLAYSLTLVFKGDLAQDFYSPLSRSWELLLGASLAFGLNHQSAVTTSWRNVAGWVGVLLILTSACFLHKNMAFPGYWALPPTLGAALVLFAGMKSHSNRVLLASRPLVAIGLISYPLYLWHWPLLSFARILASQTPELWLRLTLIGLSFILAWATYRYVEKPIRFSGRFPRAVLWLSLWMLAVLLMSHAVNRLDGLKFRHHGMLNADPTTLVVGVERGTLEPNCTLPLEDKHLFKWCFNDGKTSPPDHALIGDSKGEALVYSLIRKSPTDHGWLMLGPINVLKADNEAGRAAFKALESNSNLKVVVMANAMRGLFPLDPVTGLIAELNPDHNVIDQMVETYNHKITHWQNLGLRVVFVIDNPTLPDPNSCITGGLTRFDLLNTVLRRAENPHCKLKYSDHMKGTAPFQQFISKLKHVNPALLVYDPLPVLCDIPADMCTIAREGKFLYSYGDHISDYAGMLIADQLLPLINAMPR
ncbi:MAG: acyltransferase [Burkholderiales bacterium]|nr:acyltransferase [Burkholderiales bacterium]